MICVAVISILSSIVTQKPLITHLRMCYVCVMHENITQKTVSKWNFTPLCYSLKVKWWKKNRIHALNPWVVESLFRLLYTCNSRFSSPRLSNFIPIKYKIGAHPISPQYSFHFITTITFLTLSNLERYKHNCYFSCDRYSSKLFRSGNTCQQIKKYPAQNWYHNRIEQILLKETVWCASFSTYD